jgi:hypothetical protein
MILLLEIIIKNLFLWQPEPPKIWPIYIESSMMTPSRMEDSHRCRYLSQVASSDGAFHIKNE